MKSIYQSGAQFLGSMFRGSGEGIKGAVQQEYSIANALNPKGKTHSTLENSAAYHGSPREGESELVHGRKEPPSLPNGMYGNLYASSAPSSVSSYQSYKSAASAVPVIPTQKNAYPIFRNATSNSFLDPGSSSTDVTYLKRAADGMPGTASNPKPSAGSVKTSSKKDMLVKTPALNMDPPSSKPKTLNSKADRYAGLKNSGQTAKSFATSEKRILQENDAAAAQEAMHALDDLNLKIPSIFKGKENNYLFKSVKYILMITCYVID